MSPVATRSAVSTKASRNVSMSRSANLMRVRVLTEPSAIARLGPLASKLRVEVCRYSPSTVPPCRVWTVASTVYP